MTGIATSACRRRETRRWRSWLRAARLVEQVSTRAGARVHRLFERSRCPDPIVWRCRDGARFGIDPRSYIDVALAMERFEPAIVGRIPAFLGPGDWAIDLGANVGGVAIRLARRAGPGGAVIAYEPNPPIAERLLRNVRLNRLANVHVVRRGASDRSGEASLFVSASWNLGTSSLYDPEGNRDVPARIDLEPVDVRWRALGEPPVRFIKLDIQGGEYAALLGMRDLLTRLRPRLVLELDPRMDRLAGWSPAALMGLLREHGYGRAAPLLSRLTWRRLNGRAVGDLDGFSGDLLVE